MGEYVTDKKNMNYQNQEALKLVQAVIDDADEALNDKSRRMADSSIKALLDFTPTALSVNAFKISLSFLGSLIAGGMAAGLSALVSPRVVHGDTSHMELKESIIYKDAVAMQNALIKELKNERDSDKERIEYLTALITFLKDAIVDLRHDLGIDG